MGLDSININICAIHPQAHMTFKFHCTITNTKPFYKTNTEFVNNSYRCGDESSMSLFITHIRMNFSITKDALDILKVTQ